MNAGPRLEGSPLSGAHIDYLQSIGTPVEAPPDDAAWTVAEPELRRLALVRAVGRTTKRASAGDEQAAREAWSAPDEALLIGIHGCAVPVAFLLLGDAAGISVHLGTWAPAGAPRPSPAALDARQGLAMAALRSLLPIVETVPVDGDLPDLGAYPHAGLALGIPGSSEPQEPPESEAPLDRLVRAMGDSRWAVLVLAQPVDETWAAGVRRSVINEMRAVQAAEQAQLAPSPLGRHYVDLLTLTLKQLTAGHSLGMWRTAAYLFGDAVSFYRLAAVWRATFANERSLPEPVRVIDLSGWPEPARRLVAGWAMPDTQAQAGPGLYRRPLQHQSLLNSAQLARYVHLPHQETPGFAIRLVPSFDVVPPDGTRDPSVELGRVISRTAPTRVPYRVRVDDLTRHVFVAGVTGSGKTNTLFHLLAEADRRAIPFLVLEPAKTEYRALLGEPALGPRLRVLTPGEERVSPFRLNPFEVPPGTGVAQHLDLLRAVFGASFGMWTPLPQVLERCLREVYLDRGWDLMSGENRRLAGADPALAWPTLSELVAKVRDVAPRLGYEERITRDLEAALVTRLESLTSAGKGRMLDCRRSIPMDQLLSQPCVLELEHMGDDDDKAFLMALLLVRLAEHRRAQGRAPGLRHLLVVEEAHRLLAAAAPRTAEEQADPRGRAVETFTQLLAEVRAYGQGVVIADQVPVRLAQEVIKNTGLKVAHRTVAADDRAALAGAMAMDDDQARALTVLRVGECAVLGEGDDAPLLLAVPRASSPSRPDDAQVTAAMAGWRRQLAAAAVFDVSAACAETCVGAEWACEVARRLTGDPVFQSAFARTVLSTIEEAGALDRLWDDLVAVVRARQPAGLDERALLRAVSGHASEWYAARRAGQADWTYEAAEGLAARLRAALLERIDGGPAVPACPAREAFREQARRLLRRDHAPYPACDTVCGPGGEGAPCPYRHAVTDLVRSGRYVASWRHADQEDARGEQRRRVQTWEVCQDAAYELIEFPEDDWPEDLRQRVTAAARRVCLCFGQQMLATDAAKVPRTARRIAARLLWEAGL